MFLLLLLLLLLFIDSECNMEVIDVCYSPELHGMSVVMRDGRGAYLTSQSARFEPNVNTHTHTHTHTHRQTC